MIYKNLTAREISVMAKDGTVLMRLRPEPRSATTDIIEHVVECFGDVPVVHYLYRNIMHLPPEETGTVFIVPYSVLKALNNARPDVVAPDTSPSGVHKDHASGKVIGVYQFQKL